MPPRRRSPGTALCIAAGLGAGLALTGCAVTAPTAASRDPRPEANGSRATPDSDGTYSGSGRYETPGGPQQLDVTVVLTDGEVTAVRVDPAATNATSRRFQERFASAVVDAVVGRPLEDVAIDRLAGSSSTGAGFMAALDEVMRDAADS